MNSTSRQKTGFTLIEILVAISIFSLLILIVLGIYSRFVFTQRRDIGEQRVQEDVRLALELFNREVRTAYASTYAANNPNLYFRNQNGDCVTYRIKNSALQRAASIDAPREQDCSTVTEFFRDDAYESLTSKGANISDGQFTVKPAAVSGTTLQNQGFVTASFVLMPPGGGGEIKIQSTVASRQVRPFTP